MSAITLVNCFEIPSGREDEFFTLWQQVNKYMRGKAGYIGHKLHRSLNSDARFRFVNVAQWASIEDFNAAHDAAFRALVSQPARAPFQSFPTLYELVHEGSVKGRLFTR